MIATWAKRLSFVAMGGLVFAAAGAIGTTARSPERGVVRLSCPDVGDKALCDAMQQAIAFSAPGKVIRRVPRGQEPPSRAGDIGVAFVIMTQNASHVSARLNLFKPGSSSATNGPEVRMKLSLTDYKKLTEALVASSPHITSALQ